MKVGDKIRVLQWCMGQVIGTEDYVVEEFRHCLGIFTSYEARRAQRFTPLCELYEPGPDSKRDYIPNYGEYWTNEVQAWMDIPND